MVPGWFRAFRLKLVNNDKVILRGPPTASDGSGMAPGWLHAFRLELVSNDKSHIAVRPRLPMFPEWLRDGSARFAQSLSAARKSYFAIRPRLPMAPERFRDGSVRFAWGLSARIKSHFALRPRFPPAPGWPCHGSARFAKGFPLGLIAHLGIHSASGGAGATPPWLRALRPTCVSCAAATLGPAPGSADARVVPRRSGPKRLDCERCKVSTNKTPPDFLPKLIPSLIRLGSILVKNCVAILGWALG